MQKYTKEMIKADFSELPECSSMDDLYLSFNWNEVSMSVASKKDSGNKNSYQIGTKFSTHICAEPVEPANDMYLEVYEEQLAIMDAKSHAKRRRVKAIEDGQLAIQQGQIAISDAEPAAQAAWLQSKRMHI